MRRTAAQRIDNWNARMTSTQLDPTISAVNTIQKANFSAYVNDWTAKQEAVHTYLDGEGALPAEYFNYNAFAGEMYHIEQHFAGPAAIAAGADMVLKYTGMGCTAVRLKAIASTVFNIVIP